MHVQYHPVLTYSIYYPSRPVPQKNIEQLANINPDTIIKLLCRIKMTFSRERHRDSLNPFMNWYIGLLPKHHAARLRKFLYDNNAGHFIAVPLIINQVLVDLMNQDKTENNNYNENAAYITLAVLETLLIYNDHHFRSVVISGREDTHDLLWELCLMQDMNGKNQSSFVRTGMIKQAIFLGFLKQELKDKYDEFEKTVSAKLGVSELVRVALLYIDLQLQQDNRMAEKDSLIAISPADQAYQVIEKLNLVCEGQQNVPQHSVSNLMMKPFIRLSNNYLSFTGMHDFALISELGWAHFLHKEGTLVSLLPNLKKDNQFWSWIGTYVEKFLLATLFKSFNQSGLRVICSDDQKTPDITLVLNESDVFIIEIKSLSLHYRDWESQNLTAFKKYLTESFISEKKGVNQLYKCLQNLANDPIGLFGLRKPLNKLKIYPIIVYTEPHVSTVAVNDFVIKNAPSLPEELAKQFSVIYPPTMIECDFFLENSKVLRENKRLIKDAILHYHQKINQRKKEYQKVKTTINFSKAMETFDHTVIGFQGLYQQSQMVIANEVKKIFNEAG